MGMALLFYLEHFTADRLVTRIAMPLVAALGGSLPHFIRRIRCVYNICSLLVGIAGLTAFYFEGSALLSGSSFATKSIAFLIVFWSLRLWRRQYSRRCLSEPPNKKKTIKPKPNR